MRSHRSAHFAYVLAMGACALVFLAIIVLDFGAIPTAYTALQRPCSPCAPNAIQLTIPQMRALQAMHFSLSFYALYVVTLIVVTESVYIGIGILLFVRRSANGMALFTALMLVSFGGAGFTGTMLTLPVVNSIFWLPVYLLDAIGQIAFFAFFSLFPSGRFVPRWTIIPTVIWALSWILPIFHNPTLDAYVGSVQQGPVFLLLILTVVIAQVYRYRRVSTLRERQQTKWVVYGVGLCLTLFIATLIVGNFVLPPSVTNNPVATLLDDTLTYLYFLLIPVAVAVAVLRSRLFDVDALINRTLVYGSLTALLAGVYFGCVVLLQQAARAVTGQRGESAFAIVLSTLLIAALFQPLRTRLQRAIDRRFYRQKYDTAKTLAQFAATLRGEVELADLERHLVGVVEETMQPAHVSLWLVPRDSR